MVIIDTHKAIEKIMATGVSKETAEAIVDTVNNGNDDLVTKKDLDLSVLELKNEISMITTNINWLKTISIANFTVVIGTAITMLFK